MKHRRLAKAVCTTASLSGFGLLMAAPAWADGANSAYLSTPPQHLTVAASGAPSGLPAQSLTGVAPTISRAPVRKGATVATLAFTGSEVGGLATVAAGALGTGSALLLASRRRRRPAVSSGSAGAHEPVLWVGFFPAPPRPSVSDLDRWLGAASADQNAWRV